jgi:hypothetical protein
MTFAECTAVDSQLPLVAVVVGITLGLSATAFTFARSKLGLPAGAVAVVLGLGVIGAGVRGTARAYRAGEAILAEYPTMGPPQRESLQHFARLCTYEGVGLGAIPLIGGAVAIVAALKRRRTRS